MTATDPNVSADEAAEIARLVDELPADLDEGGPALRELRQRFGLQVGDLWPTAGRLRLALRVVGDRRRQAARRALAVAR